MTAPTENGVEAAFLRRPARVSLGPDSTRCLPGDLPG